MHVQQINFWFGLLFSVKLWSQSINLFPIKSFEILLWKNFLPYSSGKLSLILQLTVQIGLLTPIILSIVLKHESSLLHCPFNTHWRFFRIQFNGKWQFKKLSFVCLGLMSFCKFHFLRCLWHISCLQCCWPFSSLLELVSGIGSFYCLLLLLRNLLYRLLASNNGVMMPNLSWILVLGTCWNSLLFQIWDVLWFLCFLLILPSCRRCFFSLTAETWDECKRCFYHSFPVRPCCIFKALLSLLSSSGYTFNVLCYLWLKVLMFLSTDWVSWHTARRCPLL